MRKLIFVIFMAAILLVSCGGKAENETTAQTAEVIVTETEAVTEEITETAEETTPETETATETEAVTHLAAPTGEFDFSKANIIEYKTVNVGDEFEIEWDGEYFVSSHPSVCALDGRKVSVIKPGVSLIGVEGTDEAYAVCVLKDGIFEDPSAGTPTLLEVGKTAFVEGFSSSEHFSSDPSVATLNGSTVEAVSPGYVIIDMSNISMPKLFSFIVFDRNTD